MNLLKFEQIAKRLFANFPKIRRIGKRIYHFVSYIISDKNKIIGNAKRIAPCDEMEYFFGYYDQSPWDASGQYMLCLRVKSARKGPAPHETAEVCLIDNISNNIQLINTTKAWNTQQGCLLQWIGPEYDDKIIYNDFRNGKFCSVIYSQKEKREIDTYPMPIYAVDPLGRYALTLDFSRLHRLRKGYGYSNLPDSSKYDNCPDIPCIWKINLRTKVALPLLNYADLSNFEPRKEMQNAQHKVNHIMINPAGNRFMVLHRWFQKGRKYTRLVTADINGKDLYNLNDENNISHCYWKNDEEILSFLQHNGHDGYYLMKDKTDEIKHMWPELKQDGHPSYSPNRKMVITDTYPNQKRMAKLYLLADDNSILELLSVFSPLKYDFDVRCDLHPRWNRTGDMICIDSTHEGKRAMYVVNV